MKTKTLALAALNLFVLIGLHASPEEFDDIKYEDFDTTIESTLQRVREASNLVAMGEQSLKRLGEVPKRNCSKSLQSMYSELSKVEPRVAEALKANKTNKNTNAEFLALLNETASGWISLFTYQLEKYFVENSNSNSLVGSAKTFADKFYADVHYGYEKDHLKRILVAPDMNSGYLYSWNSGHYRDPDDLKIVPGTDPKAAISIPNRSRFAAGLDTYGLCNEGLISVVYTKTKHPTMSSSVDKGPTQITLRYYLVSELIGLVQQITKLRLEALRLGISQLVDAELKAMQSLVKATQQNPWVARVIKQQIIYSL